MKNNPCDISYKITVIVKAETESHNVNLASHKPMLQGGGMREKEQREAGKASCLVTEMGGEGMLRQGGGGQRRGGGGGGVEVRSCE